MLFVEKHHSLDAKKILCSNKFRQNKTHNHKLNLVTVTKETSLALAKS
jgi:hypothetical protein